MKKVCDGFYEEFSFFFTETIGPSTWVKQFCRYYKDTKKIEIQPYNQMNGKQVIMIGQKGLKKLFSLNLLLFFFFHSSIKQKYTF